MAQPTHVVVIPAPHLRPRWRVRRAAGNTFVILASMALLLLLLGPVGCKKENKGQAGGTTTAPKSTESATGSTTEPPVASGIGATSATELSENPAALYDAAISPAQLELYKVKLGDPVSALPDGKSTADQSGWVSYRQENTYRIENDKVVSLRISDPAILTKLGINNEQDLANHFKKADETIQASDTAPEAEFVYKDRWLEVWWNRKANKLTAVQINAPGS